MINKKLFQYFIILLLFVLNIGCQYAQQTKPLTNYSECPPEGNAVSERIKQLNLLKNRIIAPATKDFDLTITLEKLLSPGNDVNRWSSSKAVKIVGYVYDVKVGGIETCNCKTKDNALRDTHIELVTDPMNPSKSVRFIAEITPKWREIVEKTGKKWSTSAIRDNFLGRWVEVEGWLFFDEEHQQQAQNTRPDGKNNWRGTAWEIHPITKINVTNRPR